MPSVNSDSRLLCMTNEGFAPTPYLCPANVLTQGIGHTSMAGDPPIAGEWNLRFGYDVFVKTYEKYAQRTRKQLGEETFNKLTDNQFGALVSFVYNVGSLTLKDGRPSGLLRAVREERYDDAAYEFSKWNTAGGRVMAGLTRRREAEAALFNGDVIQAKRLCGTRIPHVTPRGTIKGAYEFSAFLTGRDGPNGRGVAEPSSRDGELVVPNATLPQSPASKRGRVVGGAAKDISTKAGGTAVVGGGGILSSPEFYIWLAVGVGAALIIGAGVYAYMRWRKMKAELEKVDLDYVA